MGQRVTLRMIAQEAGVSVTVVSMALRGFRRVNAQTRQRIESIAENLGYRPNPLMASLGARRYKNSVSGLCNLAFIFHDCEYWQHLNSELSALLLERTAPKGYQLFPLRREDYAHNEQLQDALNEQGAHGVFIGPTPFE